MRLILFSQQSFGSNARELTLESSKPKIKTLLQIAFKLQRKWSNCKCNASFVTILNIRRFLAISEHTILVRISQHVVLCKSLTLYARRLWYLRMHKNYTFGRTEFLLPLSRGRVKKNSWQKVTKRNEKERKKHINISQLVEGQCQRFSPWFFFGKWAILNIWVI